jgi:hypothetical protein
MSRTSQVKLILHLVLIKSVSTEEQGHSTDVISERNSLAFQVWESYIKPLCCYDAIRDSAPP